MRQRKIKDLETKMVRYQKYFVNESCKFKGKWQSLFGNENDIYLELGCGKGNFLIQQAELHPKRNYIGIEGQDSVIYRALQKLDETNLTNVRFACEFVNNPIDFFDDKELSGIYLNFSDPWPKDRHAHRRITHKKYLMEYHKILKDDGFIEFKTDNDELFEFTLNQVSEINDLLRIDELTTDLHNSNFNAKNIKTEYEEKFSADGKNINYMRLVKLID